MAKYLVIDLETTGLPERVAGRSYAHYKLLNKYRNSRIVSIAWVVLSDSFEVVDEQYYVVRPEGFTIPEESTRIHGITDAYARDHGIDMTYVFAALFDALERYRNTLHTLVAHNIDFDYNILLSELFRNEDVDVIKRLEIMQRICTMRTGLKCVPTERGRYPKLAHLYEYCFNKEINDAHNALHDARNCAQCFEHMMHSGVVPVVYNAA